jgi:hypothetical protein
MFFPKVIYVVLFAVWFAYLVFVSYKMGTVVISEDDIHDIVYFLVCLSTGLGT